MVLIDTHIAVFLHANELGKLSRGACDVLESHDIVLPEIARLELQYLYEINRIAYPPEQIVADLYGDIGLASSNTPVNSLIQTAINIHWTRDVFDRLIVADALFRNCSLVTRDNKIIEHFPKALSAR
ncbi:MAG: type II toxin-antitoxin system VapC family toxin [Endozoicomonas sp.]|uniref:type II toxin-antitoxin system VapC family toxin n=1 Tax=Endozoicomonas sp. TaxID=1892382 RepID=UPI003D9AD93F